MRLLCLPMMCLVLLSAAQGGDVEVRVEPTSTELSGSAFGTAFHVKRSGPADAQATAELVEQVGDAIDRLNSEMSLWDEASELSRFNRDVGGEWFPVSAGTVKVVEAALAIRDQSGGTFDPTVRPVLALWRFGPGQRPQRVPDDAEITAARTLVGVPIETRLTPTPALRKPTAGVQLDLNAIAKGYAVDVFAELAAASQPTGYMVEIGGEVRAGGTKLDGSPWRIAIEQPVAGTRSAGWAIDLNDAALATSGDYRNYFEVDGRRYSHTIDPRTGRPITHALASVSVVAEDCMTADAWATALMVLGPDEGYNLAAEHNIAAFFVVHDGSSFSSRATPLFPKLISLDATMADPFPWGTFLIAAVVFAVAVGGMAIGVIVSNRRLRGSCGGLNGFKDAQGRSICDACTTPPDECDQVRKQIASASRPE